MPPDNEVCPHELAEGKVNSEDRVLKAVGQIDMGTQSGKQHFSGKRKSGLVDIHVFAAGPPPRPFPASNQKAADQDAKKEQPDDLIFDPKPALPPKKKKKKVQTLSLDTLTQDTSSMILGKRDDIE